MNTGQYISGAGHIGLIGWMLFGGVFSSEPLPFQVTDVSVISSDQFEAMMAAERPPQTTTEVAMPAPPIEDATESPPAPPVQDTPPETAQPEVAETATPDDAPDVSQITPPPPPPAEVSDAPPELVPPSEEVAVLVPERSLRPKARPAPRVAPTPVAPPPEPEARVDDVVREQSDPTESAETPKPDEPATAPEEAVSEIVPEAKDEISAAPAKSARPKARPQRVAEAAKPKPPTTGSSRDAVKDALAEALAGGETGAAEATPTTPQGPPMSAGEQDALRVAVSKCWNLGALSTDALNVTITVGVQMSEDARPITGSIKLVSSQGGSAAAANQAYEAARRAIIRCGARGYALPPEKYDQWRDIEMTFNPEKMR